MSAGRADWNLWSPRLFPQQGVAQHDRIVVLFVACTEQQRDRAPPRQFSELVELSRMLLQLRGVAAAELLPALRVVTEPAPEFAARGDILHPMGNAGVCLAQSARPEPIDQHAHTVFGRRRLV